MDEDAAEMYGEGSKKEQMEEMKEKAEEEGWDWMDMIDGIGYEDFFEGDFGWEDVAGFAISAVMPGESEEMLEGLF